MYKEKTIFYNLLYRSTTTIRVIVILAVTMRYSDITETCHCSYLVSGNLRVVSDGGRQTLKTGKQINPEIPK